MDADTIADRISPNSPYIEPYPYYEPQPVIDGHLYPNRSPGDVSAQENLGGGRIAPQSSVDPLIPLPPPATASNHMINEQMGFVDNLLNLDVPARAIAYVMQRMMTGQDVGDMREISAAGGGYRARGEVMMAYAGPPHYSKA